MACQNAKRFFYGVTGMLVLTRKKFQSLTIGDNIKITITKIKGGQARIAIDAPKEIKVLRSELKKEVAK